MREQLWGAVEVPGAEALQDDLWNDRVTRASYGGDEDKYRSAILQQYVLYIEMADRVSQRRGLANTFFLTLNTAVITTIALIKPAQLHRTRWALVIVLAVLLAGCATWYWIVRSYRQLNAGKFAVVGAFEHRLPASPYWGAEWTALGKGKDRALYWPTTHVEQGVPLLFAVAYVAGFVAIVVT